METRGVEKLRASYHLWATPPMPVCLNHLSQAEDTPVEPISMGGKRDTAKRDIQGAIPKVELASGLRRPRTTWASPCLLQSGC